MQRGIFRGSFLFNSIVVIVTHMVILDGKALAQKILSGIKEEIDKFGEKLRLGIVVVGKDSVVEKFIEQKKKTAREVGIDTRVYPFDDTISTNELRRRIAKIVHEEKNSGVIVQLPLPKEINAQYILNAVTPGKDVDVLSARSVGEFAVGRSSVVPPVAGAVKALLDEYGVDYAKKSAVIIGAGNLVGRPVALWFLQEKITFSVIRSSTERPEEFIRRADILVTGIGKPSYITGDMVKEGAVVIDAGTSESGGKVAGDIDFVSVSKKASFITPVPGGIGPVTVAMLLKNLVTLAEARK